MIAKIKTKNNTLYDTTVFAVRSGGTWTKTCIIGFDEDEKKLQFINVYPKGNTCVFVVDNEETGWFSGKKIRGVDWIVKDKTLLKKIKKGKPIPEEIMERCRAMQRAIPITSADWTEVTEEKSAEALMSVARSFHDGWVEEIVDDGFETEVVLRVWGGFIRFKLTNATLSNKFVVGYGQCTGEYIDLIYDSSVFCENGRIYWTNDEQVKSAKDIVEETVWFSCEKMLWKLEITNKNDNSNRTRR
ncbi:MAG: hypothetical protein IJ329_02580 [Clostridia bacterium]|nr:hypothetical protein [Clostridia bacterium]